MVRIYLHFELHILFLTLIYSTDGISLSSALGIAQTSTIRGHTRAPYLSYNPSRASIRALDPRALPPLIPASIHVHPLIYASITRFAPVFDTFSVRSCVTTQFCERHREMQGKEGEVRRVAR